MMITRTRTAPGKFGALCGSAYTNAWLGGKVRAGNEIGAAQLNRRLARRYPDIPLILSHTGMTRSENPRQIMAAFAYVYANIRILEPGTGWKILERVNQSNGAFYEDWARLFEDMPDRFMVAADSKFFKPRNKGKQRKVSGYEDLVRIHRRALGSLRPGAAATIAEKTARRVFGF